MWHLKHARPQAVLLSNPHNYYSAIAQRVLHLTAARPLPSPKSEKNASRLEPFPTRIHMKPEQKTSSSNVSNDPLQQPGAFQRPLVAPRVPPKGAPHALSQFQSYTHYKILHTPSFIRRVCLLMPPTSTTATTGRGTLGYQLQTIVSFLLPVCRFDPGHMCTSSSDTCSPLLV